MLKIRGHLRNVAAIAACLAVITMFGSCEKEDLTVTGKLLDTTTRGLFESRKFVYDKQNRIKEIGLYSGGKLKEKHLITYSGNDLTKLEFTYLDNGKIVFIDTRNFVKNGNTISYSMGVEVIEGEEEGNQNINCTITLNNDGSIEKTEQALFGMTWVGYYTYTNDNLTKKQYITTGYGSVETNEKNYTYSQYRSAYSGDNTPKWFMIFYFDQNASHNAIIKSEYFSIDAMGFRMTGLTTYEYVYDRDGFPTKCTERDDGSDEQVVIEYKYKH